MAAPTWSVGQVLTASDVNTWFVPLAVFKTAQQDITSSTALTNDTALLAALAANAFYSFSSVICYKGFTNGISDFKWQWTVPAGATLRFQADWLSVGLTAQIGVQQVNASVLSAGTNGVGNVFAIKSLGSLSTGGTTGNLQLQWAQNTSSGTATTVGPGSVLMLNRIG